MRRKVQNAIWIGLLLFALTGCGRGGQEPASPREALDPKAYPALQAALVSLYNAPDRVAQAQLLGASLRDGAVQIVIDVEDASWAKDLSWAVTALGGTVEFEVDNLIQAWLAIDALPTLARHPRVLFVRLPVRPR